MIFLSIISWYIVIALAGWFAFPLVYKLFSFLPDRGLAFARPFGLIIWGYVYWLLVSLNILQNNLGSVLFSSMVVAGVSILMLRKGKSQEVFQWLKANKTLVINLELVFISAFLVWAIVRAANPDALGTEKPMELAFINAILRSPAFPPSDPWLSGYAISYYYFGYVIVAILATVTGVSGSVAFNLSVAAWFAMTALAVYGLVINLLALPNRSVGQKNFLAGIFAPVMVLIAGNLEGFLEILHARGVFWRQLESGAWISQFWKWLDIQELTQPPALPLNWQPERVTGIWWWRASRVLQDYALDGSSREVIDEFPMFSFLLGDLHPHILAMPFVILAVGLALNMFLKVHELPSGRLNLTDWIKRHDFWFVALILGGLAFINTWDFPIYLALFAASAALANLLINGWRLEIGVDFIGLSISLGMAGIILYLPFYLTFASQANGILPSLIFFTRGAHFWVMFGFQLVVMITWLLWKMCRRGRLRIVIQGLLFGIGVVAGLWLLSFVFGYLRLTTEPGLTGIWGAADVGLLLGESIRLRLKSPGTWLTQIGLLALIWGLIVSFISPRRLGETTEIFHIRRGENTSSSFILLILLLGSGLVVFPEFFYLRDQFGFRMNTIFKFYFQAWILWGIVSSFAVIELIRGLRGVKATIYKFSLGVLLILSLPYAVFGILSRTSNFQPVIWSLDGASYLARYSPAEMDAIRWLQEARYGTIVEAVGGSYTGYARISTLTGLPTVLGWPGHESQWRGGAKEMGTREADIAQLYKARNWEQASIILERYQIRYLYIGSLEKRDFRPDVALFKKHMPIVFQNDDVIILENIAINVSQEQAK